MISPPNGSNSNNNNNNNLFGDSDDDDNEIDEEHDSDSAASHSPTPTPTPTATLPPVVTAVTPPTTATPQQQQQPISKPPSSSSLDDSRKLFQRLWTDEDEIGLLRGFLDHNTQQRQQNPSFHIDNAIFYDQIKNRLQLDFNKNQLVEKLRRLKRKYRNAINRITAGKDFNFKSPHDQTTFEISHQIWGGTATGASVAATAAVNNSNNNNTAPATTATATATAASVPLEDDEEEENTNNTNKKPKHSNSDHHDTKSDILGKRSRVDEDDLPKQQEPTVTPGVIEDAIRSCVSPLLKELFSCASNGFCNLGGMGFGGVALNPVPLNCGGIAPVNLRNGDGSMDEKWRKQQILELEVYSKRVELVQEQIKSALEELKSIDTD